MKNSHLFAVATVAMFAVPEASAQFDEPGDFTIGGRLGVGSSVPARKLDVRDTGATTSFLFQNIDPGQEGTIFLFRTTNAANGDRFDILPLGSSSFFTMKAATSRIGIGTVNPQTKLHVVGTTRTTVLEITGGSDLSEQFDISGNSPDPGTVVCIDPANAGELVVSSKPYDRAVAGIISGAGGLNTGMKMGQKGSEADGSRPVALTGRVYVKADASNGPIQPGDLLTTSSLPGHAMKVMNHSEAQGAIIGKAMTALEDGQGLVLVLVSLQ